MLLGIGALILLLAVTFGAGYIVGWLAPQSQIHRALQELDPGLYVRNLGPRFVPNRTMG
jgi:hypothetical protein